MSDELKLLPCPFCGCHGVTMASDPSNPKRHAIKCEDCPGMADFHSSTAEQAIAAWNLRPTPEQSGEARDADGWIWVEDELPPSETDVLVKGLLRNGRQYDIAGLFHGKWMSHVTQDDCKFVISHWMPIDRTERGDFFVKQFEQWVRDTGALPWGGSWMAEVSSIIQRAAMDRSAPGREA